MRKVMIATPCYDGRLPVFYVDLGWSDGMWYAQKIYDEEQIPYEIRTLPADDPFFATLNDVSVPKPHP